MQSGTVYYARGWHYNANIFFKLIAFEHGIKIFQKRKMTSKLKQSISALVLRYTEPEDESKIKQLLSKI